jgi:hypothetical protein
MPSGPRAPEPWDHIPRSGDDWVMPALYTHPERPWKGCFNKRLKRQPQDTDKQWECAQYVTCYENEFMGLYLYLFQDLARRHGYPKNCRLGQCRRTGMCLGQRPDREEWAIPVEPIVPPCVPDDPQVIEAMRDQMREEYYEMGRKAGAPWAFRPGDARPKAATLPPSPLDCSDASSSWHIAAARDSSSSDQFPKSAP